MHTRNSKTDVSRLSRVRRMSWYEKQAKKMGYKGCRNCVYQIEPLSGCEWLESGSDGVIHFICPRWERRTNEKV